MQWLLEHCYISIKLWKNLYLLFFFVRIEEELGRDAVYAGKCFRYPMSSGLSKVHAREILDSRGNPTVEVDITTYKGTCFCYLKSDMSVLKLSNYL